MIWAILVSCFWLQVSHAEDRIWVSAAINDKFARLIFDSGADCPILFAPSTRRLGVKFSDAETNAPVPVGEVATGWTEECSVRLWGTCLRGHFAVLDLSNDLLPEFDGCIGWSVIGSNIIRIDAVHQKIGFLSKLPKETATWTKLPVRTTSHVLCLELYKGSKTNEILEIDTGDTVGVALNPDKWREWKTLRPKQGMTLKAAFSPGSGKMVKQEAWAESLRVGPLVLNGVPITEASPTQITSGSPQFGASLGMAALKRLDLIVDGRNGVAYVRTKTSPAPPYEHNRLGAVFMPADSQSNDLVARVLDGSPAYEAGLRNGDMLLRIGRLDVSHWRTDPKIHPYREFYRRPGTRLDLILERNGETFKTTVVLRDIIAPGRQSGH